jgi:hypothetical protein
MSQRESESFTQLVAELTSLRQRWRLRNLLEGLLLAAAAGLAALVVVVAADNLFRLDSAGRAGVALLFWMAVALAVAVWVVQRWLEDRRDDYFAALVEQRHPELANRLINALQLGRSNGFGSPRLVEAIVHDAARATEEMDLCDCLDRRTAWRHAGLLGAAAVLLAGYAVLAGARFGNGLVRVLAFWADVPPFTATQVTAVTPGPGTHRVLELSPVTISATVAGRRPREVRLYQRPDGGSWQRSIMTGSADGTQFTLAVPAAKASFEYYVRAGDGQSDVFRLDVVERPRIERFQVSYAMPAYTGLPDRTAPDSTGDLTALPGSRATVEFTVNKPLQRATMLLTTRPAVQQPGASANLAAAPEQARPIACAKAGDDRRWRVALPVAAAGSYQLDLLGSDGFPDPNPVQHPITLLRDTAPTVHIVSPGRDLQARPDGVLALAIQARDDYGVEQMQLVCRVNEELSLRALQTWRYPVRAGRDVTEKFEWKLSQLGVKVGDVVHYWAAAVDRNDVTGPGHAESRRFTLFVTAPEQVVAKLDATLDAYAAVLEELLRLQRKNRAETASGSPFAGLATRQGEIRLRTRQLAAVMAKDITPLATMVAALQDLHGGLMVEALRLLESGRDTTDDAKAQSARDRSLPIQDEIIRQLADLLARLQRAEQAKQALKKLEKTDKPAHQQISGALDQMIKDLTRVTLEQKELAEQLEKMPKSKVDEFSEETKDALGQLEALQEKLANWAKGKVDELGKLPTGFVADFGLREDVNRIFQEIEKAAERPKAAKLEVAVEDLGASLATKMLEDLEVWMPNTPDALKWVLEEPLTNRPMQIPEMPLPGELEDMIGDLMQTAEEFDEEADDVTSAWGDNLNQAGWDVSDGPISTFSAKGKTGNDQPNTQELTGRSGDGRRGKSSGQMVGDTARNLAGRDTPARLGDERYEPGNLKQEAPADPKGATGGGKKAGSGRIGLQGGTPPDFVKDMQRLADRQAGLREKAEKVAREIDTQGIASRRLAESIQLMKSVEQDLRDLRYEDAARKRRIAIHELRSSTADLNRGTGLSITRARDLPPDLREPMSHATDDGLPDGYESLVKSYFRALAEAEK